MKGERGVDSLPVALAASMVVLAAIVWLVAQGLQDIEPAASTSSVDGQVSALSNDCKAMLACSPRDVLDPASPAGACKAITLSLPGDTEYVAFGADPGSESACEGAIYYKVHGNKKVVVVDTAVKFREGAERGDVMAPSGGHVTITGGGRYELTLEYEYDRSFGEKYIVVCREREF